MKRKVLVVDDERHMTRLVQVNLERAGFAVVTAYDGCEALEKVRAEKPDLIVLDVVMPKMDGFAVLEALRRNPETSDLPVVMLTARTQDEDVLRGWAAGADCYLEKPFNPVELLMFIQRIFQSLDDDDNDRPKDSGDAP